MKTELSVLLVAAFVAATTADAGITGGGAMSAVRDEPTLLIVGPVEAVDVKHGTTTILGQTVVSKDLDRLSVGYAVAVVGIARADGVVMASAMKMQGLYVPGATPVYLSASVQKVESTVGSATVGGVSVDLTTLMASGDVRPAVGSKIQVSGIQPSMRGVILASGITGGGLSANGITGGGRASAQGITGGGFSANGITGGGRASAQGITGGGRFSTNGITGGGKASAQGITGGGFSANGITGGGRASAQGITGGGRLSANGITGGGPTANGITGGGFSANGITGGGFSANGITGGGRASAQGITGGGRATAQGITGGGL